MIPTTLSALVGRWVADSTYTSDDTHATNQSLHNVQLEIFPDTTCYRLDTTQTTFPGKSEGDCTLKGDTLIVAPDPSLPSTVVPDTFVVHLRFLGNYLELDHQADQRFTFFHKLKHPDSAALVEALGDSLWRLQGHRSGAGFYKAEALARDFSYLRFSGDTLRTDTRRNGVVSLDSGRLGKTDSLWTWETASATRDFLIDLVKEDSLRLWPLTEGRPDSGFDLYVRTSRHHPFDVDVRPLLGHMRTDSTLYPNGMLENHYGRYYDLSFASDHKVAMETNLAGAPLFTAWTLDSGFLSLDAPGAEGTRFRLDTAGTVVKLAADSGKAFGKSVALYQTKVDAETFRDKPLERFQQASYIRLLVSGDTLDYFFDENQNKDHFEIDHPDGLSVHWAVIAVNKALETYQSSQPDFFFAFQSRNGKLGRYTCVSVPEKDLVIRLTGAVDQLMVQGLIQGACRISVSDTAAADSTVNLDGSFRLKRRSPVTLGSPLWQLK